MNLALSREWSNEHHRSFEIAHVRVVYTTCVLSSKTPQNAGPTTAWHRPPLMIPLKTGISAKNSNVSGAAVGPGLAPSNHCRASPGLPETDWSRTEIGQQRGSLVDLLDPDSQCRDDSKLASIALSINASEVPENKIQVRSRDCNGHWNRRVGFRWLGNSERMNAPAIDF